MTEEVRDAESGELEAEIARTCGVLNAATGRLVGLIAQVLESESWKVSGIHSPAQWVAWQCGVSPARARSLVAMATEPPAGWQAARPPASPAGYSVENP